MPKLFADLAPVPSAVPQLEPELQQQLEASLAMYAMHKAAMEAERATIDAIMAEAGVKKAATDDFLVTYSDGGTSNRLDKKKLIAQGVTQLQIDAATTKSPKKPYTTIRKKGEKAEGDGDDE